MNRQGKFYGVGVGPGDPELLTLKARRILDAVDRIYAPRRSGGGEGLAAGIVRQVVDVGDRLCGLDFPMTEDRARLGEAWDRAAQRIRDYLTPGREAAFVTLGDPLLYSTYIYLLERVREGVPDAPGVEVETVPGISAVNAAAARLNLPLATGEEGLLIRPAPSRAQAADRLGESSEGCVENMVLLKANRNFPRLARRLQALERGEQAVVVSRCGMEREEIASLQEILETGEAPDYMSLVITKKCEE